MVFTAQDLFYDLPLSATTVVLSTISIGLFGYGICGILRPICVWHVESVYWSSLPTVKTLQGLHWQDVKNSKPLRFFWYSFVGMTAYEFFPAYIFPWLNSVSIPCLASMNATGDKASVLTNLFGGATNNEGLGLFSLSFDWQYVSRSILVCSNAVTNWVMSVDHFLPDLPPPQAAGSPGRWFRGLFCCDAWHLLYERLGCKITTIYVDTTPNGKWQGISHSQGLCWGCT